MVVLPDARRGILARGAHWIVLAACFFAGAAIATAGVPWLRTALDLAVEEVRSVTEAGFVHSPDRTAAGALPAGVGRP